MGLKIVERSTSVIGDEPCGPWPVGGIESFKKAIPQMATQKLPAQSAQTTKKFFFK